VTTSQILTAAICWAAVAVFYWEPWRARLTRRAVPYTPPPREHCGNLAPQFFESSPRTECVLRPGHQGSHANERGGRWWYDPNPTTAEEQPGA
jgi:hypothetical protein